MTETNMERDEITVFQQSIETCADPAEIARKEVRKYQIMIDGQRVAREVPMEMVGTFITGILSWHRDRAAEICIKADGKGEQ